MVMTEEDKISKATTFAMLGTIGGCLLDQHGILWKYVDGKFIGKKAFWIPSEFRSVWEETAIQEGKKYEEFKKAYADNLEEIIRETEKIFNS